MFIYLASRKDLDLDVCSICLTADDKPSTIKFKCIFKEIKYHLPLYHLIGTMSAAILLTLLQKSEI